LACVGFVRLSLDSISEGTSKALDESPNIGSKRIDLIENKFCSFNNYLFCDNI